MKRDLKEEYQNFIESDMPDLWSRIEPNLKEKKPEDGEGWQREKASQGYTGQENDKTFKILYFIKRAVPIAACLFVLVIGIGVIRIGGSKFGLTKTEAVKEEVNDGGMANGAETEAAVTQEWEAAEDDSFMGDESFADTDTAMDECAAPAEAALQNTEKENDEASHLSEGAAEDTSMMGAAEDPDRNQNPAEAAGSFTEDMGDAVEIERAVLYKIAVASEEMQEMGYAYAYAFRLEDGSSLTVYLTQAQCADMEEKGVEIKRKAAYSLSVYPLKNPETDSNEKSGEGILEKIEKLP